MASASSDLLSKDGQGCPICLEMFTSPRQLPCLHSFCEHCLQDYITKKASTKMGAFDEFMCPVCRAITRPAKKDKPVEEWASLFPESPVTLLAESKVKVERPCSVCSSDSSPNIATQFCVVCEEFMCENCSFCHQKMKISKDHQLMTIGDRDNNLENRLRFAEGFGCPEHNGKEIEFYCKTHEVACCGACSFVHHKICKDVLDLRENIPVLLEEMNPQKVMEEMRNLEDHLKTFVETNESNIRTLESQVNDFTTEIGEIRKKINAMLEDIEKMVKHEGNRIYKEEMVKKEEQNYQCQSLINAITNSLALLKTISQHGTDTQKFLVSSKTIKQLHSYSVQIHENFEKVESIKITIELASHFKAILEQNATSLVKVASKVESERFRSAVIIIPLRERLAELSKVIELQNPGGVNPKYSGVVQLQGGELVLADSKDASCCLYDSSYNFITSHTLSSQPNDMCLLDDHEVAITLPYNKQIQFLSIKNYSISVTGTLATRYPCYGVDAVSCAEIVVCGPCSKGAYCYGDKYYWSLITRDGKEKIHHELDCKNAHQAYIALDTSKSRVNICLSGNNAVYCFELKDRRKHFVYTSNDLKFPCGIAVDKESNVYVVGYKSRNIHKLSPDGLVLQVITSGVPKNPYKIAFIDGQDQFILTDDSDEGRTLHHFKHK